MRLTLRKGKDSHIERLMMVDHFRQTTLCKPWERGDLIASSGLFFDFPELIKVDEVSPPPTTKFSIS